MRNRSQLAYDHIRAKLARERIDPRKGLSEPGLARELRISRTPVREAIRRLESEGLLEQLPRRGTFVRQLGFNDLDEIYQLRLLLEPFAAAEAARKCGPADVRELGRLTRDMLSIARKFRAATSRRARERLWAAHRATDVAFHEVLLRAARNRRILKIILDARILLDAMSFPETTIEGAIVKLARSYQEHSRILHAVRRRDSDGARDQMRAHLAVGWASVREFMGTLEEARAAAGADTPAILPARGEGGPSC